MAYLMQQPQVLIITSMIISQKAFAHHVVVVYLVDGPDHEVDVDPCVVGRLICTVVTVHIQQTLP